MLVQYLAELREPLPDEADGLGPVEDGQTVAQLGVGRLRLLEQPDDDTRSNLVILLTSNGTGLAKFSPTGGLVRHQYWHSLPLDFESSLNIYGSKGRGWILCRIVSLFFQLWSINTPI